MKLPCEIVQDLLPLYHDGVCSEASTAHVEAHLKDCEGCRRMLKNIDAEIEVPKMEMEKAEPLVSIQVNWNRQNRKMLLKCIAAGIMAFVLFIGCWWILFEWYCVPIAPEEVMIQQVSRMENGEVCIQISIPYPDYCSYHYVSEDGVVYDWYKRPLISCENEVSGRAVTWFQPENHMLVNEKGEQVLVTRRCIGQPESENVIVIWDADMELPVASARVEEEYQQLLDAYAAPNAPVKPAVIGVVHGTVESREEEPGDDVQETVVPGTEATENVE